MSQDTRTLGSTLVWKIKRFSFCQEPTKYLKTGLPVIAESPMYTFQLHPFGGSADMPNRPLCMSFIWNLRQDPENVYFTMAIIAADGSFYCREGAEKVRIAIPGCTTCVSLIGREELFQEGKYLPGDTLTVYCHIWKESQQKKETIYRVCTEIPIVLYTGTWNIEKFNTWLPNQPRTFPVTANMFGIVTLTKPKPSSPEDEIVLVLKFDALSASYLVCTISISLGDKKIWSSLVNRCKLPPGEVPKIRLPLSITKKEIMDKGAMYFEKDDLLILQYEICHDLPTIHPEASLEKIEVSSRSLPLPRPIVEEETGGTTSCEDMSLVRDLFTLYSEQACSDVTLRADGREFPTHVSILSARSPVFRAMFQHKMSEASSKIIDIPDISAVALSRLLEFVYSNQLEELEVEDAIELFMAAAKYPVEGLREECSSFIKSGLSVNNIYKVLDASDCLRELSLQTAILDFFALEGDTVFQSEGWKEFMANRGELAAEIMHKLCIPKPLAENR